VDKGVPRWGMRCFELKKDMLPLGFRTDFTADNLVVFKRPIRNWFQSVVAILRFRFVGM